MIRAITFLFTLTAFAQPKITKVHYSPALTMLEGVEYTISSPQLYTDYIDNTNINTIISGAVGIDTVATISLTWSNITPAKTYSVYSAPNLRDAWVRNSPWLTSSNSLSWTQSFYEGQRFFKIVER